jgi:hypothetical protein
MGQKILVVPCGKVGALVSATGFGTLERTIDNRFRHI